MTENQGDETRRLAYRHLLIGWGGLLAVVSLGVVLESLHAFKVPFYLDEDNETRRLMWRLAHAHGGFLCLLSLAYAWTVRQLPAPPRGASATLVAATWLLPVGFLLGGVGARGGDPSLGILLVPVGALCLLHALTAVFRAVLTASRDAGA